MDKIKCPPLEWLSLYADKELSAARTEKVETHLKACPACRTVIEEFSSLRQGLKQSVEQQPLPIGFEQRFYQKLSESRTQKRHAFFPRVAWAGIGIMAVLMVFVSTHNKQITPTVFIEAKNGNGKIEKKVIHDMAIEKKVIHDLAQDALDYL